MNTRMLLALALLVGATPVLAQEGGLRSERGIAPLAENNPAEEMKQYPRDGQPVLRSYVQQPPVIPHTVRDYQIDLKHNKCMDCHSWSNYQKARATKISQTHFMARSGQELADVSPRRYFCMQCHVPQADAQPLVENTFLPVDALPAR